MTEKSKIKIPQQINVPEYKKYMLPATVPGRFIFTAIEKGLFHKDIDYKCPAVVMVIGKDIE